ncbi:hypothetical protein [Helicobacter labacensis]|uniref:hypothetical protein n=1 Tax=Helicobacter labacensis TaxID=2316079 RepID=UPI000EAEAF9D|nr:hypothetical protein [Helicobacter labacensis]
MLKYYNQGQELTEYEQHGVFPNKEELLEKIASVNFLKIADYPLPNPYQQHAPQAQKTQEQPTFQQPIPPQQHPHYKDIFGSYIGRTLYMNTNAIPSYLKIKHISTLESGQIQVDIQDVDKPHKSLKPFSFDSAQHFENWFRKYVE